MKQWTRALSLTICGGPCHAMIQPDEPVQLLTLPGLKTPKIRCVRCADDPAPLHLPQLPARLVKTSAISMNWSRFGLLPLDWKARAAVVDREPGED